WVVIFPEGTRVQPGERRAYQLGGAWIATAAGVPIVPVAHNAGLFWPRNAFRKRTGTVTVRIGPAIEPAHRIPLRTPPAPHAGDHRGCDRPAGVRAAARAVARDRGLPARQAALDSRQARCLVARAAFTGAARREWRDPAALWRTHHAGSAP